MRPTASPLAVWAGILILYFVWGSTYLGIRVAVDTIPPFLMAALRFVPAGALLAGALAVRNRRTFRRPSAVELRDTTIVGVLLMVGGMGMVAWGEQTIPSGIAALLVGLLPMWLAIFSRLFFGDRLPRLAVVGTVIGLVGIGILAWPTEAVESLDPAGFGALIVSPISWSLGSLYAARRAVLPSPTLFATGLQMLLGGLALLVLAVVTGELASFDAAAVSAESWLSVGYLLVVGSLVGYTTYAWLLTVAPLPRIATYAYVNPVVAVGLGWLILGETLGLRSLVAGLVIVAGVVLIVTARSRASGDPRRTRVEIPAPEIVLEPATAAVPTKSP